MRVKERYPKPSPSSSSTKSPTKMTTPISVPSKPQVLALFRSLLRTSAKFTDYNIRKYAKRRTTDAFRDKKQLSDPSSIASAFTDGESQLEVAKRQAIVYSMYAPNVKSIMEIKTGRGTHSIVSRRGEAE